MKMKRMDGWRKPQHEWEMNREEIKRGKCYEMI